MDERASPEGTVNASADRPALWLPPQPWMSAAPTRRVLAALTQSGREARFVGGCVRDSVLGVPVSDIDIATPLTPDQVTAHLERAGLKAVPTGAAHGTITAVAAGQAFEVTTLRRDVETFGRHARVAYTDSWTEDAARRDFTFNALSCRPDGAVFDPFGGLADLQAGVVRFVGSAQARIREDVLRILRYFRFQARFGTGGCDAEALAACRELAPLLPTLSAERVRVELLRLLTAARCAPTWQLMIDTGVIGFLLPEAQRVEHLAALVACEQRLGLAGAARALVRLAAVLATDGAGARRIAERLRLSKQERLRLERLVAPGLAVRLDQPPAAWREALVTLRSEAVLLDLALLDAADRALPCDRDALGALIDTGKAWQAASFPLTGDDVLAAGVAPGPQVRILLAKLERWWARAGFTPDRGACLQALQHRLAAERAPASAGAGSADRAVSGAPS